MIMVLCLIPAAAYAEELKPMNEEAYAILVGDTLTFYYDACRETRAAGAKADYDVPKTPWAAGGVPWNHTGSAYRFDFKHVVFDPSFKGFDELESMYEWFYTGNDDGLKVETISGIGNINTTNLTNMFRAFCNLKKLKYFDFESFDGSKIENMDYMFAECTALEKIDFGN